MDEYNIGFKSSAAKEFRNLPENIKQTIEIAIDELRQNPRPIGVVKLQNEEDLYRIRVGDYRVVYEIDDAAKSILITRVRHRREAYR